MHCFLFVAASSDQPTMSATTSDEATTTEAEAHINLISRPSMSALQPAELSSTYSDTLLQISPLPKAVTVPGARKRKSTGSAIITSSPYKKALLEKQPEKKRPKTSQKPAKTKQQAKSRKKQTSRKKCRPTASEEKVDEVVHSVAAGETSDQSKTKQQAISHKKETSRKKCTAPLSKKKVCTQATASEQKSDEVVQTSDQSTKQYARPMRVRKQCFSLAEVLRKIEADTDSDDSDVE